MGTQDAGECVILVAVFHSTNTILQIFIVLLVFDLRREVRFSMGYTHIILKCDTTHKWAMVNVTNVIQKRVSEGSEKARIKD